MECDILRFSLSDDLRIFLISAADYETYSPEEAQYEQLKEQDIDFSKNKEYAKVQITHSNL